MSEQKKCKLCQREFEIADRDLNFYRKISPTFGGKIYEIPAPQKCPLCRMRDKLAFRNESKFYKIKSGLSGKELVSHCSPDCRYKIYSQDEWYSDKWNPLRYGRDFDFSRPFFVQLNELALEVPLPHAAIYNNENCDYISNASNNKDCYLISGSGQNENCMYGAGYWNSKDCVDCYRIFECENCYEVLHGYSSMSCFWSRDIENCFNGYFLRDCVGCKDCFACANLNNKQYWAFNKQSTKEEIEKLIDEFQKCDGEDKNALLKEYFEFLNTQPTKFWHVKSVENVTGDYINNSKNVADGYFIDDSENVSNCSNLNKGRNVADTSFNGPPIENSYHTVTCGIRSSGLISCLMSFGDVSNVYYSISCLDGSKDCFGCVGLRKKQYCILNKQYSKEEYEIKVSEIVEGMQKIGEWGEFFPLDFSPFGYNDTLANVFFPIEKEGAKTLGANWQEKQYDADFSGSFYQLKNIWDYNPEKNNEAELEINRIQEGVLQCEVTKRPFKILSRELSFYIKNKIPIPEKHPEQRQKERFEKFNLYKFYHRQCMCEERGHDYDGRCLNKFETTYPPESPEKVYCEKCYQRSVI